MEYPTISCEAPQLQFCFSEFILMTQLIFVSFLIWDPSIHKNPGVKQSYFLSFMSSLGNGHTSSNDHKSSVTKIQCIYLFLFNLLSRKLLNYIIMNSGISMVFHAMIPAFLCGDDFLLCLYLLLFFRSSYSSTSSGVGKGSEFEQNSQTYKIHITKSKLMRNQFLSHRKQPIAF